MNKNKGSTSAYHRRQDGFTLIELLVVIAIIGILASVVLASLNNAKKKGNDKAVMSNLNNAQTQVEVLYSTRTANQNTYINACNTGVVDGAKATGEFVLAAAKAAGLSAVNSVISTAGTSSTATCHVTATGSAWAAEVPLKETTGTMWCVDSVGKRVKTTGSTLGANDVTCN